MIAGSQLFVEQNLYAIWVLNPFFSVTSVFIELFMIPFNELAVNVLNILNKGDVNYLKL